LLSCSRCCGGQSSTSPRSALLVSVLQIEASEFLPIRQHGLTLIVTDEAEMLSLVQLRQLMLARADEVIE
ncbi:MAG: hypothetical protein WA702_23300, partial [Bradyrhizobium sp.]|uniref:hypothetical protein n=1 Tax=Bradyrhizobium sp. TaxID=376 RepID=UPI003C7DB41A